MIYKTEIPLEVVDEAELASLVNQLAKVAGQKIEMEKQIIISTDSSELSLMLDALGDAIKSGDAATLSAAKRSTRKPKAETKKPKKLKQAEGGEKREPTRGPHVRSIKVNGSGEMISRFELNRRLQEKAIEPGTELHSPKYGKIIVKVLPDADQTFVVVNELGETV